MDASAPTDSPADSATAVPASAPPSSSSSSTSTSSSQPISIEDLLGSLVTQIRSSDWVSKQSTEGLPNIFDIAGIPRPDEEAGAVNNKSVVEGVVVEEAGASEAAAGAGAPPAAGKAE